MNHKSLVQVLRIKLIIGLFLILSHHNLLAQNQSLINKEPGKCFAKCTIPEKHEYFEISYPIYIGDEHEIVSSILDTILVNKYEEKFSGTRWIKKRRPNCKYKNSDDCLVWCLENINFKPEYAVIVIDTTKTEDYIIESFTITKSIKQGGFEEWKEVLCKDKLTEYLIRQIQQQLMNNNFYFEAINGHLDKETKAALTNFQIENDLPIGQVDFETLDILEVSY